jgi:hypothetical protein
LAAHYVFKTHSKFFTCLSPRQGVVPGKSSVDIMMGFQPTHLIEYEFMHEVTWGRSEQHITSNKMACRMFGSGGMPELEVPTLEIDFGLCLHDRDNHRAIKVFNRGTAEGSADVIFPEDAFFLEDGASPRILILARDAVDLQIVFHPTTFRSIDAFIVVAASDSAERFQIHVTARVGAPKLDMRPSNALQDVAFGICQVSEAHVRSFSVTNSGNLAVAYQVSYFRKKTAADALQDQQVEPTTKEVDKATRRRAPLVLPPDFPCALSDLIEYTPHSLALTPTKGVFNINLTVKFSLTFSPVMHDEPLECVMIVRHDAGCLVALVTGAAGHFTMDLDTPFRFMNFGMCRLGVQFKRLITLNNSGNMDCRVRTQLLRDTLTTFVFTQPDLRSNSFLCCFFLTGYGLCA